MMTREEQLKFCKKCTNREMDLQQGLLCGLTKAKADFTNECKDFNQDPDYIERFDATEELDPGVARSLIDESLLEKLRLEQNYPLGLIATLLVGLLGAILWAMITVATEYQIGYMAIAIGLGVGFTMRYTGKGVDQIFGISGALIAVVSCLLGNFFSIMGFFAKAEGADLINVFLSFDYGYLPTLMAETFSGMDLLFYGIAGYEGYKFSFRAFTEQDIAELQEAR